MTQDLSVNSNAYWDGRFNDDWEAYQGPSQSRFFAHIALEHLPHWLIDRLRSDALTVADWGCAQGDGTQVWANYLDPRQIYGVDFSAVAVQQASQRYPAIRFLHENWLEASATSQANYDVVFSSNTLEHFHNAFEVLEIISQRAQKAIVLALPYKEFDRIDEHFYSFSPDNIPAKLTNGFDLIWSKVVDCKPLPNTLWGGDQIILIYAAPNWTAGLKLSLVNLCIEQIDPRSKLQQLQNMLTAQSQTVDDQARSLQAQAQILHEQTQTLQERIQTLHEQTQTLHEQKQVLNEQTKTLQEKIHLLQTHEGIVSDLNQAINAQNQSIQAHSDHAVQLNKKLELAESAKHSQHQELMNLSNWANQIHTAPLYYAFKKYVRALAKTIYHLIPLEQGTKHKLKNKLIGLVRPAPPTVATAVIIEECVTLARQVQHSPLWATHALYSATMRGDATLLNGRDILVFSIIDWSFRIQRPQHLARSFAKRGKRVFFFSNHFVDSATPGFEIQKLDPALELYQVKLHVSGAPAIYFAPPSADALRMIAQGMAMFSLEYAVIASVSVVQHAYWYPLAFSLANSVRIYDCMDHHEGFGNVPEQLIRLEKDLLAKSDLVVVTSTWLEKLALGYQSNVAVIRNAGEYEHFCHAPAEIFHDPAGRKIIGYFGAIAEWFDLALIQTLAHALPEALILLVGNDTIQAGKALQHLSNVQLTGEVPYAQLPYYLHAFDVCLLPFQIIPLTMATNPVKVYEYLAAGKAVVAVDLPEIAQFGDLVQRASTSAEFVQQVQNSLQSTVDLVLVEQRLAFARAQTWDHRVATLIDHVDALALPKISVIVLTYNNLDLTQKCLDSLLRWNDYPNLEIIVVDNASTDGSPAYLQAFQQQHPEILLILNPDNVGFAAGNNVGLKAATGDYLVMLNNDTVVTPGWALTLMRHLIANPDTGLIGPVTNNIGNEAKIAIEYADFDQMLPTAMAHTANHMGEEIPLHTAAFFCVMIPRAIFDQVGYLDENFGLGFFEDDDYCRRIEALGKKIACAEDVFIHHHLSASFNKLKSATRQALFEKNKAYYESKWGLWIAHEYRS